MAPPADAEMTLEGYLDERGWVEDGTPGIQAHDQAKCAAARRLLKGPPVTLHEAQRAIVEATVRAHCDIRRWSLHAVNARSNHIHVVVTAQATAPEKVMEQFKAWCSRRLNEHDAAGGLPRRERWWTDHGSTKWVNDDDYFHNAVRYVQERQ